MWYTCERTDLGDAHHKCVRVALLTGRRVLLAVTAHRAELPRVVPPPQSTNKGASFRLLRVLDLDAFLAQCAATPLEWRDRESPACWARFTALPEAGTGHFGVRIAWQCSSDACETSTTVTVDTSLLTVISEVPESSTPAACTVACTFGEPTPEEERALASDEKICTATIPEDSPVSSSPELAVAECPALCIEQVAPVEATQDADVLNGAMTQRFAVRVRVHSRCDHAVAIQDLAATVRGADAQWPSRVVVGVPGGAEGHTAWLEDAGPVAVGPHDGCELVWSAKVVLPHALPGHDKAARSRAHASLGSRVEVDFCVQAVPEGTTEPQSVVLHTVFVNPPLVLPTSETCAAAQAEALAQAGFPGAQLVDWCTCDDVETLCRHFVSVCQPSHPSFFVFVPSRSLVCFRCSVMKVPRDWQITFSSCMFPNSRLASSSCSTRSSTSVQFLLLQNPPRSTGSVLFLQSTLSTSQ